MSWESRFAARTRTLKSSVIRDILKLTGQPDMISFSGGLPAPELFPVERARQAVDTVLSERGREALQYSSTDGMPELRAWIAEYFSASGLHVGIENVLITNGSQQVLDVIGRVLFDPADRVLVENPTYLGMLMAWRPLGISFTAARTDEAGLIIEAISPEMARSHKAIYAIPNFQNPTGVTMTLERRRQLARLIAEHQLPFVEDNPYGELRFEGEPMPHVLHLEAEARGSNRVDGMVLYAGTFSKVLTPGLRLGFVIGAPNVLYRLMMAKQATDLNTGLLMQAVALDMLQDRDFLQAHIATLRRVYRERRDLMLRLMAEHFPDGVRWTHPQGGLFVFVTLPDGLDSTAVLQRAIEEKVAFVPCADFYVGETPVRNTLRINFSNARPEMIQAGIERIGRALHAVMGQQV
jgi:2-aminoadipate transaminase